MSKRTQRQRLYLFARIWCVPAILIAVACIHMNQWHSIKRSSWGAGAGFGMFATVDYHGSRFFYCVAETDQGKIELDLPKSIKQQTGLIVRAIPTDANLQIFATDLSKQTWYLAKDPEGKLFGTTSANSSHPLVIRSFDLRIGGMQIDSKNKKLVTHEVNSVFFRVAPENRREHVASR